MGTSRLLLYNVLGIGYLVVTMALVMTLGLFGLVGAALVGVVGWQVVEMSSGRSESSPPERVNCTACGARNDVDREECDYCGAPL